MSIWRKIFGLPLDPSVPEPDLGLLHTLDDENALSAHKIVTACYNIYAEDGNKWLTIRIEADEAHLYSRRANTEAWIELNMLINGMAEPLMFQGAILKIPAYSHELGNLTNMYY